MKISKFFITLIVVSLFIVSASADLEIIGSQNNSNVIDLTTPASSGGSSPVVPGDNTSLWNLTGSNLFPYDTALDVAVGSNDAQNYRLAVDNDDNELFRAISNTPSSSSGGAWFVFGQQDGTVTTNGERLAGFFAQGYDGTQLRTGAGIEFFGDGTWSASSRPSEIRIGTVPTGGTSLIDAIRINQDQEVIIEDQLLIGTESQADRYPLYVYRDIDDIVQFRMENANSGANANIGFNIINDAGNGANPGFLYSTGATGTLSGFDTANNFFYRTFADPLSPDALIYGTGGSAPIYFIVNDTEVASLNLDGDASFNNSLYVNGNISSSSLINCDKINTTSTGKFQCATDENSGGGGNATTSELTIFNEETIWAERGTVVSNAYWALGNGQTPQGIVINYTGVITSVQAECATVGTSLQVYVTKNNVNQCLVTVGNSANTAYTSSCEVGFSAGDIIGIRSGTETGSYATCVGSSTLESNRTYTFDGLIGPTGPAGANGTTFDLNITTDNGNGVITDSDVLNITANGSTYVHFSGDTLTIGSTGGGGGTPAGSDTNIQYNDGGSFAGTNNLTFDGQNILLISSNSSLQIQTNRTMGTFFSNSPSQTIAGRAEAPLYINATTSDDFSRDHSAIIAKVFANNTNKSGNGGSMFGIYAVVGTGKNNSNYTSINGAGLVSNVNLADYQLIGQMSGFSGTASDILGGTNSEITTAYGLKGLVQVQNSLSTEIYGGHFTAGGGAFVSNTIDKIVGVSAGSFDGSFGSQNFTIAYEIDDESNIGVNAFGIYMEETDTTISNWLSRDNQKNWFGSNRDSSIYWDGTNMVFENNRTSANALAYFTGNISTTGVITRTSRYDKSRGSALDLIRDSDELGSGDTINHAAFPGYTQFEVTDYDRPEYRTVYSNSTMLLEVYNNVPNKKDFNYTVVSMDGDEITIQTSSQEVYYPHKKMEDGVKLGTEVDVLRQALYEAKQEIRSMNQTIISYDARIAALENKR